MTILYEWIEEPIALWIPIALLFIGVLSIVGLFIASRYDIGESFFALLLSGAMFGFALGLVFLFDSLTDDPVKKVRATVNDTLPFVEVNNRYELDSQQGDLYTFIDKEWTPEDEM